jgi:SAM-dependent methyltransferase
MQERHLDKEKYFEEQAYTTLKYIIPYITPHIKPGLGKRVLEIGCGEGGNLKPFIEAGCKATGVDLSESKIENGQRFFENHQNNKRLNLVCEDIYNMAEPEKPFDLIFMRDVIEHIHNQENFMHFVKRFLAPGGFFFLAFPPWQNPFGGHQQICQNRILSKTPWIHLLPVKLYAALLKLGGEPPSRIAALMEIKQTGLSIERIEKILKMEHFEIIRKDFFFINPNYEVKFGLKPRKIPRVLWKLPRVRNYFTTSAYYLITRKGYR